jgi:hypothetical protein
LWKRSGAMPIRGSPNGARHPVNSIEPFFAHVALIVQLKFAVLEAVMRRLSDKDVTLTRHEIELLTQHIPDRSGLLPAAVQSR